MKNDIIPAGKYYITPSKPGYSFILSGGYITLKNKDFGDLGVFPEPKNVNFLAMTGATLVVTNETNDRQQLILDNKHLGFLMPYAGYNEEGWNISPGNHTLEACVDDIFSSGSCVTFLLDVNQGITYHVIIR